METVYGKYSIFKGEPGVASLNGGLHHNKWRINMDGSDMHRFVRLRFHGDAFGDLKVQHVVAGPIQIRGTPALPIRGWRILGVRGATRVDL